MQETIVLITDRIKKHEDAREFLSITEWETTPFPYAMTPLEKSANAFVRLSINIRALNEGWLPGDNESREGFIPIFQKNGNEFLFDSYERCHKRGVIMPECLILKSPALAIYAGKQFIDDYKECFDY